MNARLFKKIWDDEWSSFKKGASERQIGIAEKRLAVPFPESYRDFLRCFNGGEFKFARMYRISKGGAGFFDLFEEMDLASKVFSPFRERSLMLFGHDYSGNFYCFNLEGARKRNDPPVVLWERGVAEKRGAEASSIVS